MASLIYYVKQERTLFRKGDWRTVMNNLLIGLDKDRETALAAAVAEAERTSILGRSTEVWIDDGHGFTLHKSFKASKPEVPEDDDDEPEYDPEADAIF